MAAVPHSWMRPPTDWYDQFIKFSDGPKHAPTEVRLNDSNERWQRMWGSQSLRSELAVPYFAVEISRSPEYEWMERGSGPSRSLWV